MMNEICLEAKGKLKNVKQGDKINMTLLVTGTKVERDYKPVETGGGKDKKPKMKKMVDLVVMDTDEGQEAAETLGEAVEKASKSVKDKMPDEY